MIIRTFSLFGDIRELGMGEMDSICGIYKGIRNEDNVLYLVIL